MDDTQAVGSIRGAGQRPRRLESSTIGWVLTSLDPNLSEVLTGDFPRKGGSFERNEEFGATSDNSTYREGGYGNVMSSRFPLGDAVRRSLSLSSSDETELAGLQSAFSGLPDDVHELKSLTAPVTRHQAPTRRLAPTFKTLEHWVGRVEAVSIDDHTFEAVVTSSTKDRGDETAEFSFDELSDDDKELVHVGAVFYWSVGYQIEHSGQRSTVSNVRFRRLPVWTRKELEAAAQKANELSQWLKLGDDVATQRPAGA